MKRKTTINARPEATFRPSTAQTPNSTSSEQGSSEHASGHSSKAVSDLGDHRGSRASGRGRGRSVVAGAGLRATALRATGGRGGGGLGGRRGLITTSRRDVGLGGVQGSALGLDICLALVLGDRVADVLGSALLKGLLADELERMLETFQRWHTRQ